MKKTILSRLTFGLAVTTLVFSSCEKNPEMEPEVSNISSNRVGHDCITFDDGSFAAGDFVSQAFSDGGEGPVLIHGLNPVFGAATNAAMIFDSNNPTGGDVDLGTPNMAFGGPGIGVGGASGTYANNVFLHNVLIISEDLNQADPNDAAVVGAVFSFDFSACGSITAESIDILDVDGESAGAFVELKDNGGVSLGTFNIAESGDNGYQVVNLGNTSGVTYIDVHLNGSGAVDNICFTKDVTGSGCTRTIGYWKNHAGFGPQPDVLSQYLPVTLGTNGGAKSLTVNNAQIAVNVLKMKTYGHPSNGITKLYAQLLAAKLNLAAGASGSPIALDIIAADGILATYNHSNWNGLSKSMKKNINSLKDKFDDYNNGKLGVAHCD